jgi:hypothetical protein
VLSLLATASTRGQSAGALSGPVIGYVWDARAGRLQPLQGVPGSATIGAPLDLAAEVQFTVPVDGSRLLLVTRTAPAISLIDLSSRSHGERRPAALPIDITPTLGAVSAHGTAVALLDQRSRRLALVSGLAAPAAVVQDVSLTDVSGAVTLLAIDDGGGMVAFVTSDSGGSSLYAWTTAAGTRLLGVADSFDAVAIGSNGQIVVSNAIADEVHVVDETAGQAQWRLFASRVHGTSKPVGVSAADDGRSFVANAGSGEIATFEASGRMLGAQACGCRPSGMYRLRDDVYRLTDRLDRTLFLLETTPSRGRILFVPPARP